MDTSRHYLAGDIHSLSKVNKIVPRKMELPLLMPTRIQLRKNLFGIKSRFFQHIRSYDYKFKSLASEPKQVIRALRLRSSCLPRSIASQKPSITERSLVEKSSSWKLPPNVYRLKDHFEDVSKRQMGKRGPYQCFTVERDASTVKNHFASKPQEDICDIFYDLPMGMKDTMLESCNRYKSKFFKSQRFEKENHQSGPSPTKYYPKNFVLKSNAGSKSNAPVKKSLFYYPNTTVPVKEMDFNKEPFFKPPPGRYDPHDVTCKCYLTENSMRCPGNVVGHGHRYVFDSTVFRLVHPVKTARKRLVSEPDADDATIVLRRRPSRDPISFRIRRSLSCDDLMQSRQREIRFNTMVKKRNVFSVKTGRPVGFLSAMPRFKESSEMSVELAKEEKKEPHKEMKEKSRRRKPMTKKRLEELAAPKNPLPRIVSQKVNTYEPLPLPSSSHEDVREVSIIESPSGMSEIVLVECEPVVDVENE